LGFGGIPPNGGFMDPPDLLGATTNKISSPPLTAVGPNSNILDD